MATTPIRTAVVVSLLIHAALILQLPSFKLPRFEPPGPGDKHEPLSVQLIPRFVPPPAESNAAPAPAPRSRTRPRTAPPPPPPPPVITAEKPSPAAPPAAAVPQPQAPAGDLLAYVESRRRARAETADPVQAPAPTPQEDERTRANRVAAANLATQRQVTFGYDPSRSGGVFTIERLTADYAEFTFVGWNSDARRRTKQLVEVSKGNHEDIRLAVVRQMIAIIRRYEPEEFTWESRRLNRVVTLSARARDNAGLEDFMLKEFF